MRSQRERKDRIRKQREGIRKGKEKEETVRIRE